jgi:hypothetical protein
MAEPGSGTPPVGGLRGFWQRRSRKGKVWIVIATLVVIIAIIGALASPSDKKEAASGDPATVTNTVTVTQPTTTAETAPPPPPAERAPPPIVLSGQGARVETINLAKDSPAVVAAVHRGASNFVIEMVGAGASELLVNVIGNYGGKVAYAEAAAGRYRVRVQADGRWTIWVTQPVPGPNAKLIPGAISGKGPNVVRIRTDEDLQPVVDVTHRGQSNFIVELIGYGDTSGSELLVNEIGTYSGQTLVNDLPEGGYLLAVQADGPWTVRFTR